MSCFISFPLTAAAVCPTKCRRLRDGAAAEIVNSQGTLHGWRITDREEG